MRVRRIHPSTLCAAILAAVPFHADAIHIDYVADLGIERNDNVIMSSTDPEGSTALRAGFGFAATEETSAVQANFGGRVEYWDYLDGPQSDAFEASLTGRLNWSIVPETFSFTVEDSLESRPIDRFIPDTADNRQLVNVLSLGPNALFNLGQATRGRFELRWINSQAEEANDLESQRISAALHLVRELDSTSNLSLGLRGQDVDFKYNIAARDHRRYSAYLRYEKQLDRLGFGLDAGYTWVDFSDGDSASNPLLRGRIDWEISTRNTLSISAARQLTDSADSALAGITLVTGVPDRLSTASVTVNASIYEENRADLSWRYRGDRAALTFGPYYERIDYLDATASDETRRGALMVLSYRLAPGWDLRAFGDAARSDFLDLDIRTEDLRAGIGMSKAWSRHWSSALDYVHYRREADGALGDSRQNVWYLTLAYRNR